MSGVRSHTAFSFLSCFIVSSCLLTAASAESVRFRLDATDVDGKSLESINVGDRFYLSTFVEDVSDEPIAGVFAAYLDVAFDEDLVSTVGPIEYGTYFSNGKKGELLDGMLDNIGGFSSGDGQGRGGAVPVGPGELMVTRVEMEAVSLGTAAFVGSFANDSPTHDVLLFGLNEPVVSSDITFGSLSLPIQSVPEPNGLTSLMAGLLAALLIRHRPKRTDH